MRTVKRSPAMKPYSNTNKSRVAAMKEGDFYSSEQSHIMTAADTVSIHLLAASGAETCLKSGLKVLYILLLLPLLLLLHLLNLLNLLNLLQLLKFRT